jgi:protein O-mannosyl-transferase
LKHKSNLLRLLTEKAILIALLAASAAFALMVMKSATQTDFSLSKLLPPDPGRVPLYYATYLWKMFWPAGLAIPYPYPDVTELWKAAVALLFLLAVSFCVFLKGGRYPYLPVGWLWYLITLSPVVGLVRMGPHEPADRYTYIPLIGIFIMAAWGVPEFLRKTPLPRTAGMVSAVVVLLVFAVCSRIQLGYWKDSVTLFTRTVEVTRNNFMAHNNLGLALEARGEMEKAGFHYSEAVRIRPWHGKSHYNLALAHAKQGNVPQAITHLFETVRLMPDHAQAHNNLGAALAEQGRFREAAFHFSEAVRINPGYEKARGNLTRALQALESPAPQDQERIKDRE